MRSYNWCWRRRVGFNEFLVSKGKKKNQARLPDFVGSSDYGNGMLKVDSQVAYMSKGIHLQLMCKEAEAVVSVVENRGVAGLELMLGVFNIL